MQKIEGEDNRFRPYCEKILIDLLVYPIYCTSLDDSTLSLVLNSSYNMVEYFRICPEKSENENISSRIFPLCLDFMNSHLVICVLIGSNLIRRRQKLMKSPTNSGIVNVDIRGKKLVYT